MFDNASVAAILLALIAGLSTLVGALIVLLTNRRSEILLTMSLGLAAGVMLSVSFLDFMPEASENFAMVYDDHTSEILTLVFMAVGAVAALLADKFVPHNCGSEEHIEHHDCSHDVKWIGVVTTVAIALHNLPEGIALYFAGYEDITLGIMLCVAVILHNIPGGITIAMPIYYSSGSKTKAFLYTLIPSVVQPLAAVLACVALKQVMTDFWMGVIFALVAGLLIVVALVELYPTAVKHHHHRRAGMAALLVGIVIMPLTHMLSH